MDLFTETLNNSCRHYQQLHDQTVAAIEFARQGEFEEATLSINKINSTLAEIKIIDKTLLFHADESKITANIQLWNKRISLLSSTLSYQNENLPHIESMMAMKKDQIQKIRDGRRGLNGYHVGTGETGKFIKNST